MTQQPPRWNEDQFAEDSATAIAKFREMRIEEPLEQYLGFFDVYREAVEELIEGTVDLTKLAEQSVDLLTRPEMLVTIRYLASPAISEDDLKVVADALLSPTRIRADEEMAKRIVATVLLALDRNRFPWVSEERDPTTAERETAVVATAALIATQKVQTARRNQSKDEQEEQVAEYLVTQGFKQVPTRNIDNISKLPDFGEFCRESTFSGRKADLVVRVWDGRTMPIECKVSNSSTNSVKRLNNDAAAKATAWITAFGTQNVIPTAVLSGVFKVHNLVAAQTMGLTIFWAHKLDALGEFLEATKP
ncbi:XamI family restriction endonuclease [Mycobacteroides abscessus]|uniref:XamI family restriction endonuclease n=1 Tax=Mycobacteroides abscessus TaxID=36809 RepID=UPI0009260C28|nr:XamI family restriction endonuclease [Mycobacteroides abscessus]SIF35575.1 XamI restriction endonuclease [Mycobacteroides abscessus subsp. abscessus]